MKGKISNMPSSEEDIEKIILEGKLDSFILGKNEFLTDHPGTDYSRWRQLGRYYKSLSADTPAKEIVDNTIIDLYKEPDESTKLVAIILGRILRLSFFRQIIVDTIINSDILKYGKSLQDELLFSATSMQLPEVSIIVVRRFIVENRLGEYLMASSTPPYEDHVGEDDIWRVSVLEQLYNSADTSMQASIRSQLEMVANYSKRFRLIIVKFLSMPKTKNVFYQTLENILTTNNHK